MALNEVPYQMVAHSDYGGRQAADGGGPKWTRFGSDWCVPGASGSPVMRRFSGLDLSFTNVVTHVTSNTEPAPICLATILKNKANNVFLAVQS